MRARSPGLSRPIIPAALLTLALGGATVQAHDLFAEYRVLQGRRVQVESWFEGGGVPLSGKVRVLRVDGSLLRELPLNAKGLCIFQFDRPEDLRLEVSDDTGHRAHHPRRGKRPLVITAAELLPSYAAAVTADVAACLTSPAPPLTAALLFAPNSEVRAAGDAGAGAEPLADHSRHIPFDRIVLGVALLLAVPLLVRVVRMFRPAQPRH